MKFRNISERQIVFEGMVINPGQVVELPEDVGRKIQGLIEIKPLNEGRQVLTETPVGHLNFIRE